MIFTQKDTDVLFITVDNFLHIQTLVLLKQRGQKHIPKTFLLPHVVRPLICPLCIHLYRYYGPTKNPSTTLSSCPDWDPPIESNMNIQRSLFCATHLSWILCFMRGWRYLDAASVFTGQSKICYQHASFPTQSQQIPGQFISRPLPKANKFLDSLF